MKQQLLKVLFMCMAVAFLPQVVHAVGDIEINATNFPDENFRKYLLEQDYGKDGKLTENEIKSITSLNIMGKEISSLQGIEYFTKLIRLDCSSNNLTALDVSGNVALTYLDCSRNQLTVLDVSGNTELENLWCNKNQLTALDTSKNTQLGRLCCHNNQLTILNVSKSLWHLNCSDNQLTTLNVSKRSSLMHLDCSDNQLTDLYISGCTRCGELYCQNNQLTDLVISGDIGNGIGILWCYNNQLTTLDVSECAKLYRLKCFNNQLTTLNISGCTGLEELWCYNNQIKGEAMNDLISSLPTYDTEPIWGLTICIYSPDSPDEGNVCTKEQVQAAQEKGWNVRDSYNIEYEGSDDIPSVINGIMTEADKDIPIYNLRGQRLTTPQKGINIIGGRKVIVR